MVLLVVDTQKLITNPDLYNFNAFENAVKTLIAAARENNVEVIYVRHDDGVGAVAIAVGAADENVIHAVAQRLGLLGGHVLLRLLPRLKLLRCDWNGGRLRRFFLGGRLRLRLGARRTLHRLHQQLQRRERASGDCQHDHRRDQRRACTARQRGLFCMRRTAAIAK